ncbi:uncharacterized protein TRIVIDRAFT_219763 [Trichoderma virens Gv29-8]|uniref:Uncharacterized protein n=1 Tax=Hypocrea virens (strain Gv29-8 / FGSC 10586) TaxID=413071 RepID=G9MLT1_HYPVG|nr:uncharacterized protein TRIVIDRAFT_219763 [Trichoderma virens Gv29-8]EHK24305.1 hypothetical protein TRIVIDRAFT_219763 [Trichoderma virens Gv29-8]UKZ54573.1 hypothetical protein TrVGV298_008382 [Trichoderma virens]
MQILTLVTAAIASVVSATQAADDGAQATGVIFYEHTNYGGLSYQIPSTNRCWPLPQPLFQKASSIQFISDGVTCALFRNRYCFPPVLYAGLQQSVPDLHDLGIGDEVGSVHCTDFNNDNQ